MYINEQQAIDLLNQGDIVALPTETVYGLASRFDREDGLIKVFKIKNRPSFDPLIVHVSQIEQVKNLATQISKNELYLMETFWPGPLTIVLPKKDTVSDIITSGLSSVAVRMPQNQSFRDIIQQTAPLAAPSANLFGHTSPTTAEHVENEFNGNLPIFDGGPCTIGIESTVIELKETQDKIVLHILRPGMTSPNDLVKTLKSYSKKEVILHFGASKVSPGHVENHYQPRMPLVLIKNTLTFSEDVHKLICTHLKIATDRNPSQLSYSKQDPTLVARILYSDFHRLSQTANPYILLEVDNDFFNENWHAVRDRIEKASSLSISQADGQLFVHKKLENFK